MADVVLTVGSVRHSGWTDIAVTRSLLRAAHSFELTLTNRWDNGQPRPVRAGERAKLSLGNELLVSGLIDTVQPQYTDTEYSIRVKGRSAVANLIDCSTTGQEFKNQTLLQIANNLAGRFGVAVRVADGVDIGARFASVRLDPAQPMFEFLELLARMRGVLLTSNANGELVITRAGTRHADTALELGKNVVAANGQVSLENTFRRYTVIAQQGENPLLTIEGGAYPQHSESNFAPVHAARELVIEMDGPADIAACKQRAIWERNARYGRSRQTTFTVRGFQKKPNGRSWQPNEKVQVRDDFMAVNGERLIVETRLILDEDGSRTELDVQPVEAFSVQPLPEPSADEVWG